jgi:hypothetical protein
MTCYTMIIGWFGRLGCALPAEIADDGSYRLNSGAIVQSALRGRLIGVFGRRGERVLFVKALAEPECAGVAAAIDTAHGVNIDRVALELRPKSPVTRSPAVQLFAVLAAGVRD